MVFDFRIPVPCKNNDIDIEKQKAIADVLAKIDEEISLNNEKIEKIKKQRKILQKYLLNGIVRVN